MPPLFIAYWGRGNMESDRPVGSAGQTSETNLSTGRAGSSGQSITRKALDPEAQVISDGSVSSDRRSSAYVTSPNRTHALILAVSSHQPLQSGSIGSGAAIPPTLTTNDQNISSRTAEISSVSNNTPVTSSSPTAISTKSVPATSGIPPSSSFSPNSTSALGTQAPESKGGAVQNSQATSGFSAISIPTVTSAGSSFTPTSTTSQTEGQSPTNASSNQTGNNSSSGEGEHSHSTSQSRTISLSATSSGANASVTPLLPEKTTATLSQSSVLITPSAHSIMAGIPPLSSIISTSSSSKASPSAAVKAVDTSKPSSTTPVFSTTVFPTVVPTTFRTVHTISSGTRQQLSTQVSVSSQTLTTTQILQPTLSAGSGSNPGSGTTNPGSNPATDISPAKKNVGAIAGGVVGGLALLSLLIFLGGFLLRRMRSHRDRRFAAQLLSDPHSDLFRPTPSRTWDVEGNVRSFVRPMDETGFRVVTRVDKKSGPVAGHKPAAPSVSEDPFWDPSQLRPLEIIPAATPDKLRVVGSAPMTQNPFVDPPEYRGTLGVTLIGPSRLSNSSSQYDTLNDESNIGPSGLAV